MNERLREEEKEKLYYVVERNKEIKRSQRERKVEGHSKEETIYVVERNKEREKKRSLPEREVERKE